MQKAQSRDEEWRELIFRAFRECLKQDCTYAEATVKKICEEAHISKPTFYRYFENKEDMCAWAYKKCLDEGFTEIGRTCSWFVGFYRTCRKQMEYSEFFAATIDNEALNEVGRQVVDYMRRIIVETLTRYHQREIDTLFAFQIEALLASHNAMIRYWGTMGMEISVEEMAAYLTSIVPFGLYAAMREPAYGYSEAAVKINTTAIKSFQGRQMDLEVYQGAIDDRDAFVRQIFAQYYHVARDK